MLLCSLNPVNVYGYSINDAVIGQLCALLCRLLWHKDVPDFNERLEI
jgi:hypothetical protein